MANNHPTVVFSAVTPNDSTDIPGGPRAFYVGGSGNLVLGVRGTLTTVTFTGINGGTLLPVGADRVMATGTTATSIVALF